MTRLLSIHSRWRNACFFVTPLHLVKKANYAKRPSLSSFFKHYKQNCIFVFGKKYANESKYETPIITVKEFQEMLDELFFLNGVFNIEDWLPWLDFLDSQGYVKRMKALIKKFDQFLDHIFDEHKAKKEGVKDFVPKDIVNVLLQLADDPNVDIKLTYDNIKAFIQVIPLPFYFFFFIFWEKIFFNSSVYIFLLFYILFGGGRS